MGYKRGGTKYRLVFEDDAFAGLEVVARSIPLGAYLELMDVFDDGLTKENTDTLFGAFTKVLVSWNIEDDDDQPVPTTVEGLYSLDLNEARVIIEAWRDAVTGVTGPLGSSSTGGEPSPVASIPMETLPSESRVS